jgi:hypothetical protein
MLKYGTPVAGLIGASGLAIACPVTTWPTVSPITLTVVVFVKMICQRS